MNKIWAAIPHNNNEWPLQDSTPRGEIGRSRRNLLLLSNKKKDASCAHSSTATATARPQLSQPYASKSLTHLIWTIPCWYDAAANLSIASKWFGGRYIDDIFVMMNRDDKMMYNFSLTTLQAVLSVHSNIRDFHIDYLYSDKVHIAWLLQW